MARFTKTRANGEFMGWDELSPNAECTEATLPGDLGVKMPPDVLVHCENLEPGSMLRTFDGIEYFREW